MLTLIVPFYRNVEMLREQIAAWEDYPAGISIVLVDDGSPEDARSVVTVHASEALQRRIRLLRILVDIPWNRGGARNLGVTQARTDWIVHVDIDHVMTAQSARNLLEFKAEPKHWYRFERWRNGKADETRRKDKIAPDVEFGKIHPHIDSYLCTRALYWKAGGYNEDFSGCLGGGSPFLALLEAHAGPPRMLPAGINLQVFTRSIVKDSSDWSLSRDRGEFAKRKEKMKKPYRGHDPIRFPWTEQDLCIRA
jgi:hypothetical protein